MDADVTVWCGHDTAFNIAWSKQYLFIKRIKREPDGRLLESLETSVSTPDDPSNPRPADEVMGHPESGGEFTPPTDHVVHAVMSDCILCSLIHAGIAPWPREKPLDLAIPWDSYCGSYDAGCWREGLTCDIREKMAARAGGRKEVTP